MKRSRKMIIGFLTPAVLAYIIMFLYPTVRTILMSFFSVTEVSDPTSKWTFSGVKNYIELFDVGVFRQAMWNIFRIWLIGFIVVSMVSLVMAITLTTGIKGKKVFRAIIYLPDIIAAIAMGTMWVEYIYSAQFGLLNKILGFFGANPVGWTGSSMIFWSMLIAYCFGSVGKYMLIYISGIEQIPVDYFEAATLDGAGIFRKFFFITLPLLKNVFHTNITLWTTGVAGFFVWSQVFAPLGLKEGTVTPMIYMYNLAFGSAGTVPHNAGRAATIGVVMTLLILLVFSMSNLIIRRTNYEM